MLVVHVHVRVRPERIGDFLAATVINARASLAEPRESVRYSVVFPVSGEGWVSDSPWR